MWVFLALDMVWHLVQLFRRVKVNLAVLLAFVLQYIVYGGGKSESLYKLTFVYGLIILLMIRIIGGKTYGPYREWQCK